jgi:hypothetical protein
VAKRTLNRHELRDQAAAAEALGADGAAPAVSAKAKAAKKPAKPRAPRAKKPPPRRFAHWGVFDGGMKEVASFDYNQRDAADEKLADLQAHKKGPFFLQIVKEARAEAPAAEVPAG